MTYRRSMLCVLMKILSRDSAKKKTKWLKSFKLRTCMAMKGLRPTFNGGPPFKAEERQLGWRCCTESTATSLLLMELRTSSNHHHNALCQRQRYNQQFSQPHCRTQYQQYSFLPRTIRDWNDLPRKSLRPRPSTHLCQWPPRL